MFNSFFVHVSKLSNAEPFSGFELSSSDDKVLFFVALFQYLQGHVELLKTLVANFSNLSALEEGPQWYTDAAFAVGIGADALERLLSSDSILLRQHALDVLFIKRREGCPQVNHELLTNANDFADLIAPESGIILKGSEKENTSLISWGKLPQGSEFSSAEVDLLMNEAFRVGGGLALHALRSTNLLVHDFLIKFEGPLSSADYHRLKLLSQQIISKKREKISMLEKEHSDSYALKLVACSSLQELKNYFKNRSKSAVEAYFLLNAAVRLNEVQSLREAILDIALTNNMNMAGSAFADYTSQFAIRLLTVDIAFSIYRDDVAAKCSYIKMLKNLSVDDLKNLVEVDQDFLVGAYKGLLVADDPDCLDALRNLAGVYGKDRLAKLATPIKGEAIGKSLKFNSIIDELNNVTAQEFALRVEEKFACGINVRQLICLGADVVMKRKCDDISENCFNAIFSEIFESVSTLLFRWECLDQKRRLIQSYRNPMPRDPARRIAQVEEEWGENFTEAMRSALVNSHTSDDVYLDVQGEVEQIDVEVQKIEEKLLRETKLVNAYCNFLKNPVSTYGEPEFQLIAQIYEITIHIILNGEIIRSYLGTGDQVINLALKGENKYCLLS